MVKIESGLIETGSKKFSEIEFITEEIQKLRKKPNKNRRDKDNIELLEIRLKQLYNY